tara:strand:+ start:2374 stop:2613 length:240 start_codon:yes stop_codon:yes gene_type:complete
MSKINRDGLQDLQKNIKGPLESMYNKAQKGGSLTWADMKDAYDHMYRFLEDIESKWDVQETMTQDPTVIINNKVFEPKH